ncbi:hypothetical protein QO179_23695 [Bacillus stercoris]|nr:hypothetical protein [Bacillus stercoris]
MIDPNLYFLNEKDVIICKGIDPRSALPYILRTTHKESLCTCFDHDIPIVEALGFSITDHWVFSNYNYKAVKGLEFLHLSRKTSNEYKVDSRVTEFLKKNTKNKMFSHLLSKNNN